MKKSYIRSNQHFPISIIIVIFVSCCWWVYLSLNVSMIISADASGYERLGRLIVEHGFSEFLKTGPNREPLLPLTVALSMWLSSHCGLMYQKIQGLIQLACFGSAQILLWMLLRRFHVRIVLSALILLYFGCSPAMVNSVFSLFSEVLTYPIILGIIYRTLMVMEQKSPHWIEGVGLGVLSIMMVLVKGITELIIPLYIICLGILFWRLLGRDCGKHVKILVIWFIVFGVGVSAYKAANYIYNRQYVVTDRSGFMVYGSAVRKTAPIGEHKISAALLSIAGDKMCANKFPIEECFYWSPLMTDRLGQAEQARLGQFVAGEKVNSALLHETAGLIQAHPIRYLVFSMIEAVKMFFWESASIGFVEYPKWIERLYQNVVLSKGLRLCAAVISFWGVLMLASAIRKHEIQVTRFQSYGLLLFIGIFIFCYAFVSVIIRYSFPIVPLYFVCIGISVERLLLRFK